MSDEKRKGRPWLAVLVIVALAVVVGQAAYLFYLQRNVVTALNGVYGELANSPELNALLDVNAALPQAQTPSNHGPDESTPAAPAPDLDRSLKNLQGLLGPDSSGTVQQLLDMVRQLSGTYDSASGVTPAPQQPSAPAGKQPPAERTAEAVHVPDVSISETPDSYRLEMDFGKVNVSSLTAAAKNQTIQIEGNTSGATKNADTQQPFKGSFSLNAPIDPDSLTMANAGSVYTVIVKKKAVVT